MHGYMEEYYNGDQHWQASDYLASMGKHPKAVRSTGSSYFQQNVVSSAPLPLFVYRPHHNVQSTELVIDEDMNDSDAVASAADLFLVRLSTTLVPPTTVGSIPFSHNRSTAEEQLATAMPISSAAASLHRPINLNILAYCYILPVICVLGIIGNLMNVVTLASPRLRAVSYMYLRALAVADLLCMLFVLAFACCEVLKEIGVPIERSPFYGFYQAHVMLSFINWALATGVFIVVALSLERYVSVVFPLHFRVWNSPQRAMKAIIVAYIIPAVFYIPYGIGRYSISEKMNTKGEVIYGAIDSEVSKTLCWQIYKWTREAMLRFLPIIILFVLNFQIMIAFRRRQRMFDRLRNRDSQRSSARDDTLLYILGGIAVMFFVCNIPAAINLLFINETVKKRLDYQIFRAVANLLEITNHAAQFYIFCVCSSDYRVTFMQKFPCLRAYYINKSKLCSLLRHVPKQRSTAPGAASACNTAGGTARCAPTLPGCGAYRGAAAGRAHRANSIGAGSAINYSELEHHHNRNCCGRGAETTFVRSTTITGELASTSGGGRTTLAEQETVDVQLASEESLSDESETLLQQQQQRREEEQWQANNNYMGTTGQMLEGHREESWGGTSYL